MTAQGLRPRSRDPRRVPRVVKLVAVAPVDRAVAHNADRVSTIERRPMPKTNESASQRQGPRLLAGGTRSETTIRSPERSSSISLTAGIRIEPRLVS